MLRGGKFICWDNKRVVAFICLVLLLCAGGLVQGQGTQPVVAIHDSELTRALETMPAAGATPTGAGFTGKEWFISQWHYFVLPNAMKEALRSDGTQFTVVGDTNIAAGGLTNANGSPKYPILICLGAEAIQDNEIAPLTNYVAAGGFLFVGGSSFTRNPNGTPRGDFAIANAMGVHMVNPALTNWYFNDNFSISSNHRLLTNIPAGLWPWQMPESSEEISWPADIHLIGETPNATTPGLPHMLWQVTASNATVIATGDSSIPYLMVKAYGKGWIIYDAALQPLIGHGGWAPGMYAYSIFRNAIQWAFQSAGVPIIKNSPWPYPYDAAVMFRHDMEAIPVNMIGINRSAQFEFTNGASGDYYICTGTLRQNMPSGAGPTSSNSVIASLQAAITNYGATICPHNGGLTNVNPVYSPGLVPIEPNLPYLFANGWLTTFEPYTSGSPLAPPLNTSGFDYDYWHWSPDEIMGKTNLLGGFTNGSLYALQSLSNSFNDVIGWRLTNGSPRTWCAPYFNSTKEGSYQIQDQLGIKVTGDDKLTPFPHWIFSTQTPDKTYPILSEPVSDWFVTSPFVQVAQSLENGHNPTTVQQLVDAYYNMGALINLYNHSTADGTGMDGTLPSFYTTYSLSKPRVWSANAARIYNWWVQRSNAQMTVSFATNASQSVTTIAISGNSNTNAAIELVLPSASFGVLQVSTNGALAGTNVYRTNGLTIKLQVGTTVTNVVVSFVLPPTVQNNFYQIPQGGGLSVAAPGVLTNGTAGATASLVNGVVNGTLSFNADGSFNYTPTNNFTGVDNFTYVAVSGSVTSAVATATIMVTTPGQLFTDTFARPTNSNSIFPWIAQLGTWGVTNSSLIGTGDLDNYAYAYYDNPTWSNYTVQAQIQYSNTNGWGGAISGRLNPVTGARYGVWVYPEGSPYALPGGFPALQIIKYTNWTGYTEQPRVRLTNGVGTNLHTVKLSMQSSNLVAYFDGVQITNLTDNGAFDGQPALRNGGIVAEFYTQSPTTYRMAVDNVTVTISNTPPVASNDVYTAFSNLPLRISAPGVLTNDTGSGTLTALLSAGPIHGTLVLTNNGGFTYTPSNNYVGPDSFTYRATDGQSTSSVATVSITVSAYVAPRATNDLYTVLTNAVLSPVAPGVLTNDSGGSGPLTALLSQGPANGSFTLTNNGGFSYQPTNNFSGIDLFTYAATDGQTTSAVATAAIVVNPTGVLFNDNFARSINLTSIFPWTLNLSTPEPVLTPNPTGSWVITNGVFIGTSTANYTYTSAYFNNPSWTNYSVSAQLRVSNTNGVGAGLCGRLNGTNGARYSVWMYPENSPDGSQNGFASMLLYKYRNWTNFTQGNFIRLPAVGTNQHTVKLTFQGNTLYAYFDGTLMTNWTDNGAFDGQPPYTNGGIAVETYEKPPTLYTTTVDNLTVNTLSPSSASNDIYSVLVNTPLRVSAPGVLTNDVGANGNLTTLLSAGPTHGTLILTNNGGFTYTPSNNYVGPDAFTYRATDGPSTSSVATVSITVTSALTTLTVAVNNTNRIYGATNPVFTVSYLGFVNGDTTNVLNGSLGNLSTSATAASPAGSYTITNPPGTLSASNYIIVYTNGTLTVNPALLAVTANNTNRIYGATNPVFTASYSGFVNSDTTAVLTGAPSLTTSATTNSPASTYIITNTVGTLTATNYVFSFTNGLLTINPVALTVTASNQTKAYGQTLPFAGTEFSVSGLRNGDNVTSVSLSSAGATAGAGVGGSPYSIAATNAVGSGLTNYVISYASGQLTVTPALLAVTADNTNRFYGATNPVFTASYSGFVNSETVSALNGTPNLITAATTNSPAGTYVITNSAGSLTATNYAFSFTNGLLTINPVTVTVTASNRSKAYGQTVIFSGMEFLASGLRNGDSVTNASLSSAGAVASAGVAGSPYAITVTNASGTGLTNYTISYVNGTLTVNPTLLTVTANNTNRFYGATNPVFTVNYGGFVNGETINSLSGLPSLTTSANSNSPAGNYPITNSVGTLAATNYVFTFTNGLLTVNPAALTVTASNVAKTYGQPVVFAGTEFFTSGLRNGDNVISVSVSSPGAAAGAGVTGSPYGIAVTNAVGSGLTNYAINYVGGQLTVSPAPLTVIANNTNRFYGATNPIFTASFSGFVNSETVGALSGFPSLTTAATTNSPAGNYTITNSVGTLAATNYAFTFTNGLLTVNSATLTVTASNLTKTYGQTVVFGGTEFSASGLRNGDNVMSANLTSAGTVAGAGVTGSPYSIAVTNATGTGLTNYTILYANGQLTVNPARLAVTANNTNRLYGTPNPVFTTSYNGFVNSETASALSGAPSLTTAATTNSPTGIYPITNTVGTLAATNYTFTFTNGLLTVNPATLTVTASNLTKTYGQPVVFAGTEFFTSALLNNDAVTNVLLSSAGAVAGAGVDGSPYNIVAANATGIGLTNYTINYAPGQLIVNPAVLAVIANDTNRLYGATNPIFTASYNGFVNSETASALSGSPSLTTAATSTSPIGNYAITNTVGTLAATNYTFSFTNSLLTINPATLTVTASNQTKMYGQTLAFAGTEFFTSSPLNGDSVTNVSLSSAGAATNAGVGSSPYSIAATNAAGTGLTNYAINYVAGGLTVTPAMLTVTANDTNRAFGAANPLFTANYAGFLNGDTTAELVGTPSLTTTATTNSPAGDYAIVATNGTLNATNYYFSFANGTLTVILPTVTPPPVILSVGLTNAIITVTWSSVSNAVYGLQYATNLTAAVWNNIVPNVTATGATASQTNAVGDAPQQFYRVSLEQAAP